MVFIRCGRSFGCLSIRFGVFIGANFGFAGGALFSTVSCIQIVLLRRHPLVTRDKIALYIQAVIYTLLAIISLIGMLATLFKRLSLVSLYRTVLPFHLVFSLASGGFSFYSIFRNASGDVTRCINGSTDRLAKELCTKGWSVVNGITVGLFIFLWLVQIYNMILADILREDLYTDDASEVRRPKLSTISSPIPIRESNSYMGGVMFKYGSVLTKPKYPHPYDIRPERSLSHFSDV